MREEKEKIMKVTKKEKAMTQEQMMTVKLSSCGNPDFRQNPNEPLFGCPKEVYVEVATLKGASLICLKYIDSWELGGGNWDGGQVYEGNKQIARVSYNGRVWDLNDKEILIN